MVRRKLLALPLAAAFAAAGFGGAQKADAAVTAQDQCGFYFNMYNYWYDRWGNDWVRYGGDFDNQYVLIDYGYLTHYSDLWYSNNC